MFWEEVDVIIDNHQVANLEFRIHTARSVAYKEGFNAQLVHHTFWEGYSLHVISFIVMESSFHSHDVFTS